VPLDRFKRGFLNFIIVQNIHSALVALILIHREFARLLSGFDECLWPDFLHWKLPFPFKGVLLSLSKQGLSFLKSPALKNNARPRRKTVLSIVFWHRWAFRANVIPGLRD
jgi:hypothetical protein